MYRHAEYINCTGCGRCLSLPESELDEEARYICTRCHALHRVDLTIARWRKDARADKWRALMAVAAALLLIAYFPVLLLILGTAFLFSVFVARQG